MQLNGVKCIFNMYSAIKQEQLVEKMVKKPFKLKWSKWTQRWSFSRFNLLAILWFSRIIMFTPKFFISNRPVCMKFAKIWKNIFSASVRECYHWSCSILSRWIYQFDFVSALLVELIFFRFELYSILQSEPGDNDLKMNYSHRSF